MMLNQLATVYLPTGKDRTQTMATGCFLAQEMSAAAFQLANHFLATDM
jgi:hypothetical protein